MSIAQTINLMSLSILSIILVSGCQRSDQVAEAPEIEEIDSTQVVTPVVSSQSETEDINRQWLPPEESRLSSIEVQLIDIRANVDASREAAQQALTSEDTAIIEAAQAQLDETHAAIYGLAVRMRSEWTQMEFQSFMTDLRYHELLDLKHSLDLRRSTLSHEAWLWSNNP